MQLDAKVGSDLRRLTHLIALAEEKRFARAAVRVHLSEAAFSRSIRSLEEQMGIKIFDRDPRGVTLTRAGTLVLDRARALVFDSISMQRDIDLMRLGDAGEVAIGAAPVPAATIMPGLLSQLTCSSPQLVTRVRFGNLMALIDKLDAQELDFCLGEPRLIVNHKRYATALVAKQKGAIFCRRGHPAAKRPASGLEVLRRHGVASISMTPALLEGVALGHGFDSAQSFPLTVECDDINMLAELVAKSDVLGLLPEGLHRASALSLRRLELKGVTPVIVNVHAVWLKGRTMSPAAARAVQLAQQIGGRLSG